MKYIKLTPKQRNELNEIESQIGSIQIDENGNSILIYGSYGPNMIMMDDVCLKLGLNLKDLIPYYHGNCINDKLWRKFGHYLYSKLAISII